MKMPWNRFIERKLALREGEIRANERRETVRDLARSMGQSDLGVSVPTGYPQNGGSPLPLYGYDRPIWYATPNSPRRRPDSAVTVDTIRQFADSYDILRSCINHLKREVSAQPFNIVAKDARDDSPVTKTRVAEANEFFSRKGGLGLPTETRRHFEAKIFEDLLVTGAFAVWKGWSR